MTMPDILINTENIFLNRGICELLSEIAKEEHIREPYSVVDYFTDILGPIDMLFTEMAAGEHYLCHPFFKKLPPHTSIFIFVATDSALQVEQLPLCLGDATLEGANKQVISSQADSLIKISRIWADFFPANTSNQPI
ncbi:hypothetical protein AE85_05163 [Klebsiella pneumoniae CHS 29]|nr:hypothetical protein AE85_05163 [Klebsiella pneumoniae CHS 29]